LLVSTASGQDIPGCRDLPPAAVEVPPTPEVGYLYEKEPKRLALVVGNSVYKNLPPIVSARADAESMAKQLFDLKFQVTICSDVPTLSRFQNEIFQKFRKKIEVGDLVLFYFSGHGFSYGPNSFLAPTDLPLSIPEEKVASYGISVDAFEDRLAGHFPGLIMFFLDACRSTGGFIIRNKENDNVVGKGHGAAGYNNEAVNTFTFFATRPGEIAEGFSSQGKLSIFTRALVDKVGTEGQPFISVFRRLSAAVKVSTNDKQEPELSGRSDTDPYLKPTQKNLDEEMEAWKSALASKDRNEMALFIRLYSVSRHAAACRKWLDEDLHNGLATASTLASPVAIDRAWRTTNEERVSVRRLTLPFAFTRSVAADDGMGLWKLSDSEIGLVRAGTSVKELDQLRSGEAYLRHFSEARLPAGDQYRDPLAFSLASIDAHGSVVSQESLMGRDQPNPSARIIERIRAGTPLQVNGITTGLNESIWVSASTSASSSPFFLRVVPRRTSAPLELGQSIKEVIVPPRLDSIPGLVDRTIIDQAIADMKAQGWKIQWVSLSTAPTYDKHKRDVRAACMANARYLLKNAGVDGRRITSVSSREDFSGDGVRVRFFGVK